MSLIYKYNIVLILTVSMFFSACSHENPLEKNSLGISGKFLYDSSLYSEKKLNSGESHGGQDFGLCVEDKIKYSTKYCHKLYGAMIIYAKNNSIYFKNLTVEDLMDSNAYFQVKSYYYHYVYMKK